MNAPSPLSFRKSRRLIGLRVGRITAYSLTVVSKSRAFVLAVRKREMMLGCMPAALAKPRSLMPASVMNCETRRRAASQLGTVGSLIRHAQVYLACARTAEGGV